MAGLWRQKRKAVCRDMHTADQPIDDWIFGDLTFFFDSNQITTSNFCPFRKLFLSQTTLDTGIFDSQTNVSVALPLIVHLLLLLYWGAEENGTVNRKNGTDMIKYKKTGRFYYGIYSAD